MAFFFIFVIQIFFEQIQLHCKVILLWFIIANERLNQMAEIAPFDLT